MTNQTNNQTTLVIGGTGKTGRRVTERLSALGVRTRAGTRSGEPAFDWADPNTWEPALADVASAYVSYHPDVAAPGAADRIAAFATLAVEHGVRRLVLLSGRGEDETQRGEQAVREAGAEWTVVRSSWFNQNFSEGMFLPAVLGGEVALPIDEMVEPFVDADDIADVAVAALTRQAGARGRVVGAARGHHDPCPVSQPRQEQAQYQIVREVIDGECRLVAVGSPTGVVGPDTPSVEHQGVDRGAAKLLVHGRREGTYGLQAGQVERKGVVRG